MKCETNLSRGLTKISESKRPGMVIIHKSTCSACNSLKPKLLASKEIERLSNFFIVISLMDDAAPRESKFYPDGKYVPRIFFLDTSGQVMREVMNTNGNSKYKYYYSNEQSLITSMQKVLSCYPDIEKKQRENQAIEKLKR